MKINAVFTYGASDDGSGAEEMVQAVNELCGVEISQYAEINFDGMKALVDAVGGIDIYVPEGDEVDDPEAGPVTIEAGQQHMDGEAALTFCRARHQFADGDYTRMRHQRMVLGALADKILNNLDIATIPSLVESLADMVHTSLSVSDIISLVNAMRGMDVNDMYSANIPSWAGEDTYINGQSYVFVYEDALEEMMARVDAGEDPEGPQTMARAAMSPRPLATCITTATPTGREVPRRQVADRATTRARASRRARVLRALNNALCKRAVEIVPPARIRLRRLCCCAHAPPLMPRVRQGWIAGVP
mgnify:CR=1 FL=1